MVQLSRGNGMTNLIEYDKEKKIFHLHNQSISYLIMVEKGGTLSHLYFGKRIRKYNSNQKYPNLDRGFSGNLPGSLDRGFSRDTLPKEYSSDGEMDYHTPATIVQHEDGDQSLFLVYDHYQIQDGKPELNGLPSTYVENEDEAQTLTITLKDKYGDLEYNLKYTIYRDRPVITRSVQIKNSGSQIHYLKKVASMQMDFVNKEFDVISLPGAHANERQINRAKVDPGIKVFSSCRGASSHQMNPFIALVDKNTDENNGQVYGFAMVYSGNHKFEVEKDQIEQIHLVIGINDYNFSWKLNSGNTFQTPEVIMVYSDQGLNKMSHIFHNLTRERIISAKYRKQIKPILLNSWEAMTFNINENKLKKLVNVAQDLGIEMFVVDDGWFGHRDDDNSSLGDWYVNKNKFPNGLSKFIEYVHEKGLKFGLWFEPEMVSLDSKLNSLHPDYLMQVPSRKPSPCRNQYVLDFSRKEVRENIFNQIDNLLSSNKIDYIKWDMNRHISDIYSLKLSADQQGEVCHRYILGLYEFLDKLTKKYPNILFESCSGGGGRFDLGMAYYMPIDWTSDNTDAAARMKIQYGTSLVYPPSLMTAHVSDVPNGGTGRTISLSTRGAVAMSAVFGYEMDLTKLKKEEKEEIRSQINFYKQIRKIIQFGVFYRLKSPFNGIQAAWMFVSDDQKEAVVMSFNFFGSSQPVVTKTLLKGLNPEFDYKEVRSGQFYGGDELMNFGLFDPIVKEDYSSKIYYFRKVY